MNEIKTEILIIFSDLALTTKTVMCQNPNNQSQ